MSLTFYPDKPAEWLEALAVVKLRIDDENLPSEQRETMSDTLGSAHTRALDSDTRVRTLDAQLSAARGVRDKKNTQTDRLLIRLSDEMRYRNGSKGFQVLRSAFGGKNPSVVADQPHDDQLSDTDKFFIEVDARTDLDLPSARVDELRASHLEFKDAHRAVRDLISEHALASTTAKDDLAAVKPLYRTMVRRVLAIHGEETAVALLPRFTR